MDVQNATRTGATISLSIDELGFLGSAINETLEALEEWEFQTRTGETRERAIEIFRELRAVLHQCKAPDLDHE
jgi:hypothetical protein